MHDGSFSHTRQGSLRHIVSLPSFIYFKDLQEDFKSVERWNLRAVSDSFSVVTFIGIAVGSPG